MVGDPVRVTVVAGLTATIPRTLRPSVQGTATIAFVLPAVSLAAGLDTTCAVMQDGTLRARRRNEDGQLGDGAHESRDVATRVSP